MDIKYRGAKLRELWGDKPCDHPSFMKETMGAPISGLGYVELKTGDYVCTQCGRVFTKEEMEQLKNSKSQ